MTWSQICWKVLKTSVEWLGRGIGGKRHGGGMAQVEDIFMEKRSKLKA